MEREDRLRGRMNLLHEIVRVFGRRVGIKYNNVARNSQNSETLNTASSDKRQRLGTGTEIS